MLYADKPIYRPDQDLLGRAPFARELANAIDRLTVARDGFVMAVIGGWGSGKSSAVELIVRYLMHMEMERRSQRPLLWDSAAAPVNGAELERMAQAIEPLEGRIATIERDSNLSLARREHTKALIRSWVTSDQVAEDAYAYWRLRLAVREDPRTVVIRFSPWLIAGHAELADALLSDLARGAGAKLDAEGRESFAALLTRLAEFAPVAAAGAGLAGFAGGSLVSAGGQWATKVAARMATGPTLDETRSRLRFALNAHDTPRFLIVVDDLDRLTPQEALQMISLVKSLGDLPNVIYLLTYEEHQLAELIKTAAGTDGLDYLSKIVQYKVDLPKLDETDLSRMLDADLQALLGALSDANNLRIAGTWHHIFGHYLKTPRDVRRFINALSVSLPALREYVDPIDLTFTELLRVFEPTIYQWVRDNLGDLAE